jgi:hypothetical protein
MARNWGFGSRVEQKRRINEGLSSARGSAVAVRSGRDFRADFMARFDGRQGAELGEGRTLFLHGWLDGRFDLSRLDAVTPNHEMHHDAIKAIRHQRAVFYGVRHLAWPIQ